MKRVCVFCGSRDGGRAVYLEAARRLGAALAGRGIELVYGGAQVGLMGAVADAALKAGGRVIGIIPRTMMEKEAADYGLSELRIVGSMHERKAMMAELADAFIALPGGFGTLEEFCEIVTWAQLGFHRKPCALLNIEAYFTPLLAFFDYAVVEHFVPPEHRALILVEETPDALLDMMKDYEPPRVDTRLARSAL